MKFKSAPPKQYVHQADATLSQANPGPTTWYTILDTTRNCRVLGGAISVATTGEDLLLRITIDGNVLEGSKAATAGTQYYMSITHDAAALYIEAGFTVVESRVFFLEGKSIKIEMRKTTTNGTGTFTARVKYAVLKP